MTKEELLAAAARAETYPPGRAYRWFSRFSLEKRSLEQALTLPEYRDNC